MISVNDIRHIQRLFCKNIYIWSPSVFVDHSWEPVKKYIEKDLKVNKDKEKVYFDEYHHEDLENVIDTQYKLIDHMKKTRL